LLKIVPIKGMGVGPTRAVFVWGGVYRGFFPPPPPPEFRLKY